MDTGSRKASDEVERRRKEGRKEERRNEGRNEGRKEGRKEHIYLTILQCTIHIYKNRIDRRLSLRLNKAASAIATEIIIT